MIESLYYLGYSLKRSYDLSRRKRLPFPVISIGNITVGGTGKTPAAIAVAKEAKRRGFYPVILTRGYKGKSAEPCFVDASAADAPSLYGDEPALMAEKLKDVPVVKCADRYEGGIFAIRQIKLRNISAGGPAPTPAGREAGESQITNLPDGQAGHELRLVFILDDGFQHWRLHRDRDILLIDAGNPFGNRKLLPAGRLREPLSEIGRADCLVITRSDEEADKACRALTDEIRTYNRTAPVFLARHVPTALRQPSGKTFKADAAAGRGVFGFCALGNPGSFRKTIELLGGRVVGMSAFRDHFYYSQKDIDRISGEAQQAGADWIATTEKDIIKAKHLDLPENVFAIEIDFSAEGNFFDEVFRF